MALSSYDLYSVHYEILTRYAPKAIADELRRVSRERRNQAATEGRSGEQFEDELSAWYRAEIAPYSSTEVTTSQGDGSLTSRTGTRCWVRKNWINISLPNPHAEDAEATVVASLQEGSLQIGGITITAWRGPQNGIYAVCDESIFTQAPNDDSSALSLRRGMLVCGVYGYSEITKHSWKQVEVVTCWNHACDWAIAHTDEEYPEECPECGEGTYTDAFSPQHAEPIWAGIEPESLRWFQAKIALEMGLDEHLQKVDVFAGQRWNQGDVTFAQSYGVPIPTTAPGEADDPMLKDAVQGFLRRMDDESNDDA